MIENALASPPPVTRASPSLNTTPSGEPADSATARAITDTTREWFACPDTGRFPVIFAVYTAAAVVEMIGQAINDEDRASVLAGTPSADLMRQSLAFFLTPLSLPDPLAYALLDVGDVTVLADGRVRAVVTWTSDPAGKRIVTSEVVFRQEGGRYRIDTGGRDLGTSDASDPATPASL